MIILEPINRDQTVGFIANIANSDLPITGATFDFLDSYSGNTTQITADIVRSGFRQSATFTVQLENERRYELTVSNGNTVIHRDSVYVTAQVETEGTTEQRVDSLEGYSVNNGQFVRFNDISGITNNNRLVSFNDIR